MSPAAKCCKSKKNRQRPPPFVMCCVLQDAPCAPGRPIKKLQHVRLQHGATRKWLHSHQFYSPMSGNQEVCAGQSHNAPFSI